MKKKKFRDWHLWHQELVNGGFVSVSEQSCILPLSFSGLRETTAWRGQREGARGGPVAGPAEPPGTGFTGSTSRWPRGVLGRCMLNPGSLLCLWEENRDLCIPELKGTVEIMPFHQSLNQ